MTKKLFYAALICIVALCNSCKGDSDEGVENPFSTISGLYINEVYSSNPRWVELFNDSDREIDINGFTLNGIIFTGEIKIAAKSYYVVDFTLSLSSGRLVLLDPDRKIVDEITFPTLEDGQSHGRVTDGGSDWRIFDSPTKGKDNTSSGDIPDDPDDPEENIELEVFINEVYSSNPDWIELYNASDDEVDISGFTLQDDKGENEQYILPQGTKIAAKSYLVLDEGTDFIFGLSSSNGDKVVLLDLQLSIVDEVTLPKMEDGKSYGRVTDGADEWKVFDKPTKGMDNATEFEPEPEPEPVDPSLFEHVILTEICGEQKYVEIYNKGSEEVSLVGLMLERNEGASSYIFTSTDVIPAGAYRLILFNSHPDELEDNDSYVGWDVSSGISDQQTLSIQLITISGDVISSFQRGVAPWGTSGAERERDYSYSRMDDDSWAYADFTPGTANGEKTKEIINPDYTSQ